MQGLKTEIRLLFFTLINRASAFEMLDAKTSKTAQNNVVRTVGMLGL
jgi:hypothetical protein